MSVRDLCIIFLKLFGLSIIVTNLSSLAINLPFYLVSGELKFIGAFFVSLLIMFLFVIGLWKYAANVVSFISPCKGLDSPKINFAHLHKSQLLEIGILIIALYLIITKIDELIGAILYFFQSKIEASGIDGQLGSVNALINDEYAIKDAVISIVLGVIIIALRKWITRLFG